MKRKSNVTAIVGSRKDDNGTDVQAVVFPRTTEFESQEAREQWLMENDYENNGCEEAESGYRYQQTPESKFKKESLHSVPFGDPDFPDLDSEGDSGNSDEPASTGNRKRVIFRMSQSLYEKLRTNADDQDLSANQLVCRALQKYLEERGRGSTTTAQTKMQELRDLKETRDLLDPKKDKGLIEKLQEHIRQCVQEMTGEEKGQPRRKKWYEERSKYD